MDTSVYSSTFVCDNVARRLVASKKGSVTKFGRQFFDIASKLGLRIAEGRVVSRQEVALTVGRVVEWLDNSDFISNVHAGREGSKKLSSRENFEITFMFMQSDEKEQWIQISKGRVIIGRKEIDLKIGLPVMRIHRHAIARIIHRERISPEDFVPTLGQAGDLANLLSHLANQMGGDVALTYRGGLMLGRVRPFSEIQKDGGLENDTSLLIKRGKPPGFGQIIHDGSLPVAEIMSFVDGDGLTPAREQLRREIAGFVEQNKVLIPLYSSFTMFGNCYVPIEVEGDYHQILERLDALSEEASRMMESDAWDRLRNRPK